MERRRERKARLHCSVVEEEEESPTIGDQKIIEFATVVIIDFPRLGLSNCIFNQDIWGRVSDMSPPL